MSIAAVNDRTIREGILPQGVTLVEFGARWCPPCKALLPILERLQQAHGEKARILQVDSDECREAVAEYGILSIPTVLVLQHGVPVEKIVGLRPIEVYEAVIGRYQ